MSFMLGGFKKLRKRPLDIYKYRLSVFEKFVLTNPVYGHPKYNPLKKNKYMPKKNLKI